MATEIRPFRISVSEETLADLRTRLGHARHPDLPDTTTWADGCDVRQLRTFLEYWRTQFDWRGAEARLNRWPQFLTTIDGAQIHFAHIGARTELPIVRNDGTDRQAIPLLLLHGWPGSLVEFLDLTELLTAEQDGLRFEIVIPSLPGFGFSRRAPNGTMGLFRTADVFARLMRALGYERFFVQGGDFGAGVGSALALRHPDRVRGLHLNYIPGSYRPTLPPGTEPTAQEQTYLKEAASWSDREGAYSHVQRTKPQALSFALTDSPAGLAAWILEKFATWADCEGDLGRLPRELLATNLTLYWATKSIATSIEFYRDVAQQPFKLAPAERVSVPCALARFPREAPLPPRSWVERGYNIVRWTELAHGGHFAAIEQPQLLATDLRAFIGSIL